MAARFRVLFIAPHLMGGGSERVLVNLVNGIDRDRFATDLLVIKNVGPLLEDLPPDVRLLKADSERTIGSVLRLKRVLAQNRYDLVFTMKNHLLLSLLIAAATLSRKPKIVYREVTHISTDLFLRRGDRSMVSRVYDNRVVYRFLYARADRIVAPSAAIREDLISAFDVPAEKITVINNPVDVERLRSMMQERVEHPWFHESGIPVVVAAGRLARQKGFDILLKAFRMVIDSGVCARLVILGDGELRAEVSGLISTLALSANVALLGHQRNPFKYMSRADLFVLSSLWEGFPNALLEAMACGAPVISTDCPSGPSEIIQDGTNGILVPTGRPEDLAREMVCLLGNDAFRRDIGVAGRETIEQRYSLDHIVPMYNDLFMACLW